MAAPKRTKIEVQRDRTEIAERYLRGEKQADIAASLGMTPQMVSYDLKAVRAEWRASRVRVIDEKIEEELAKIDLLELTYWQAWQLSLEDIESQTLQAKPDAAGKPQAAGKTIHTEPGRGNLAALVGVQWCINRRIQLLGLDAPKKVAPTDPTGKKEYGSGDLSDDQRLARVMALLEAAGERRDRAPSDGVPIESPLVSGLGDDAPEDPG